MAFSIHFPVKLCVGANVDVIFRQPIWFQRQIRPFWKVDNQGYNNRFDLSFIINLIDIIREFLKKAFNYPFLAEGKKTCLSNIKPDPVWKVQTYQTNYHRSIMRTESWLFWTKWNIFPYQDRLSHNIYFWWCPCTDISELGEL